MNITCKIDIELLECSLGELLYHKNSDQVQELLAFVSSAKSLGVTFVDVGVDVMALISCTAYFNSTNLRGRLKKSA